MIVGKIYRTARPYSADEPEIGGYPNFFYETHCPGKALIVLERGIFSPTRTVNRSGSMRAVVILSKSIASKGTGHNPWEDEFDEGRGIIYYSGDNKTSGKNPKHTLGNKELLHQFQLISSETRAKRIKAAPIVCFERVKVGDSLKGFLKFHGFGFVNDFKKVTEQNPETGSEFENFRFEIKLLPPHTDNEFNWEWVTARRMSGYTDEDCLSMSPDSWQQRIELGFFANPQTDELQTIADDNVDFIPLWKAIEPHEVQLHSIAMLLEIRQKSDGISGDQAFRVNQDWYVSSDWFDGWLKDLVLRHKQSQNYSRSRESTYIQTEETNKEAKESDEQHRVETESDPTVADRLEEIDRRLDEMLSADDLDDFKSYVSPDASISHGSPTTSTQPKKSIENPPGDYFKIELCQTFTPLNRKIPQSYVSELDFLAEKRRKNVRTGKGVNAGMPETKEEQELLKERFLRGDTISELTEYFQRSEVSIEIRLDRMELLDQRKNVEQDRLVSTPKESDLVTGVLKFTSSLRATLNVNVDELESSLSALNENVEIDEPVEDAPLCVAVEKLLKRVNSEMDVLQDQLRASSEPETTKRLLPSVVEELDDLRSDLEILKPRVIQVLDVQKESMVALVDILSSLRELLDGLPEDALIQHLESKEKSEMLRLFATSGKFFPGSES